MQISALPAAFLRRVRIRSWKDLIAILAMSILYYVISLVLRRVTELDEGKIKLIAGAIAIVIGVIIIFALHR